MLVPISLIKKQDQIQKNFNTWYTKYQDKLNDCDLGLASYHYGDDIEKTMLHLIRAALTLHQPLAYTALGLLVKDQLIQLNKEVEHLKLAKILLAKSACEEEPIALLHLLLLHQIHGQIAISQKDFDLCETLFGIKLKTVISLVHRGEISRKDYSEMSPHFIDSSFDQIVYDQSGAVLKNQFFNKILNQFLKKAKPDANELFAQGLAYEHGIGLDKKNPQKACKLYISAQKEGHVLGQSHALRLIQEHKNQHKSTSKPIESLDDTSASQHQSKQVKHKKRTRIVEDDLNDSLILDSVNKAQKLIQQPLVNSVLHKESGIDLESPNQTVDQVPLLHLPLSHSFFPPQPALISERDFNPEVRAKQNANSSHFFRRERKKVEFNQPFSPSITQVKDCQIEQPAPVLPTITFSSQALAEIGRWGEEFFYYSLIDQYRSKYPNYKGGDIDSGYKLSNQDSTHEIEINWLNKNGESYVSYDFKIIETINTVVNESLYEVKTTTSKTPFEAHLSHNEFLLMLKCAQSKTPYSIARVLGAGTKDAVIEMVDEPLSAILEQELEVKNMTIKI